MKLENFRKYMTKSGKFVLAGKDSGQNEDLIGNNLNKDDLVFHTASSGSPFCVVKGDINNDDLKEIALFCARYSREWKKSKYKKDVLVHYFKGKDIYKEKGMKKGTFGVRKFRVINTKKEDIERLK